MFASIRRVLDALVTALGVVFGVTPDPTLVPVEQDDPTRRHPLAG